MIDEVLHTHIHNICTNNQIPLTAQFSDGGWAYPVMSTK